MHSQSNYAGRFNHFTKTKCFFQVLLQPFPLPPQRQVITKLYRILQDMGSPVFVTKVLKIFSLDKYIVYIRAKTNLF